MIQTGKPCGNKIFYDKIKEITGTDYSSKKPGPKVKNDNSVYCPRNCQKRKAIITMNNGLTQKITTNIFLIILGIVLIYNPEMTETKFGFGYPGNLFIGIPYILICSLFLIKNLRDLFINKD